MPSPEGRITKVMRTATFFLFHFTIFVLWWAQVDGQSLAHTVQGNPKEEMKHFAERGRKDLSGTVLILVLYSTILVHGLSLTSAFFLFLQWSLGRLPLKKSACVVQGMTLSTVTYRNSSAELTRGKEERQIWERRIDCLYPDLIPIPTLKLPFIESTGISVIARDERNWWRVWKKEG